MNGPLNIAIECIPSPMFSKLETNADIILIYIDSEIEYKNIIDLISSFSHSSNLQFVMTGGYKSEALHDHIDYFLEDEGDQGIMVSTAWSEDSFSETLWEFINVHGSFSNNGLAKILIISDSKVNQRQMLTEIAVTTLAE